MSLTSAKTPWIFWYGQRDGVWLVFTPEPTHGSEGLRLGVVSQHPSGEFWAALPGRGLGPFRSGREAMLAAEAYTKSIWGPHIQRWQELGLDVPSAVRLGKELREAQGALPRAQMPHALTYADETEAFGYAIARGVLSVDGEDQEQIPLIHTLVPGRGAITVEDVYGNLWHILGQGLHIDVRRAAFPRGVKGAPVEVLA